jgi:hypothetical protein
MISISSYVSSFFWGGDYFYKSGVTIPSANLTAIDSMFNYEVLLAYRLASET